MSFGMSYLIHSPAIKQAEKLAMIRKEARRIREEHEAGRMSATEAARLLTDLRRGDYQPWKAPAAA